MNYQQIDIKKNSEDIDMAIQNMKEYIRNMENVFEYWITIDDKRIPIMSSNIQNEISYGDVRHFKNNILHLGQFKLLMSEICFLTKFMHMKDMLVVYVGGAEGYHIKKLAELFTQMKFELYDACKFSISETINMKIFNRYFNDDDAFRYKNIGKKILFISDIRNHPNKDVKEDSVDTDVEKNVIEDMETQRKWVKIIKPHASSLKFRLPYEICKTYQYLDGYRMLQPYAPFSTEVRLFSIYRTPNGKCTNMIDKDIQYECNCFDKKMAYFNSSVRNMKYNKWSEQFMTNKVINNWDNTISFYILQEYLRKNYDIIDDNMVTQLFIEIVDYLGNKYGCKYNYVFYR